MSDTQQTHDSPGTHRLSFSRVETLSPRSILQDRYEIIRLVGIGGMGAVYQARDLRFEDVVKVCAVKEMINATSDARLRQIGVDSFSREANILAALSYPGIPKIFDFFSEGQRNYLVLEFIDGRALENIIATTSSFVEETQAVDWAIQICDVLVYLHSHQPNSIVFRDLKPSNIMIDNRDRVMLVDFGIAKVFQSGEKGTMIGTEGYSPPEQYRGSSGPGGDIYALGATLHHLLTKSDPRSEPPFTFQERLPRVTNPQVSEGMEAIIMKALEYEPENRFASASEMKRSLLALIASQASLSNDMGGGVATATVQLGGSLLQDVLPIWEFVCEDEVRSSPRVENNALYAGAYDNNLYALNALTGELIWKYPTEAGICSSPAIWQGQVYIGSEDNIFYCVRADNGRIVWSHPTNDRVRSSPRVALDHVFFGSDDGSFYGLNAGNGREVWKIQAPGSIRSTAYAYEDMVFFSCSDGNIYALDIQNGRTRWRFSTTRQIVSSPTVIDNLLIVGSHDWNVYAIDAQSGFNVWRRRTNEAVAASPTIFQTRIYVGSVDKNMYCLDGRTGRVIWKYAAEEQITSSAAVTEEAVYFGCIDHHLYKLERKTGELTWRFRTGGPIPSSPVVTDEMVYVGSTDNRIYALPL
ncbi:MAG: serine/threonine-protein kinase [Anaerolineales bacterium]|nr:serine/threonine-protein kinase [Anaerolineales bacterium]